jgi:hypothetical protein
VFPGSLQLCANRLRNLDDGGDRVSDEVLWRMMAFIHGACTSVLLIVSA